MNPFEVVPLITSVPCKVASLACGGDSVYVGTSDGQVLLYRAPAAGSARPQMMAKCFVGAGRKSVERLQVVASLGRVLALADGVLSVLDMRTLDVVLAPAADRLPAWRQCAAFCQRDAAAAGAGAPRASLLGSGPSLAVAAARAKKVLIYDYIGGSAQYEFRREVALADPCTAVLWAAGKLLAVATRKDVLLVDSDSGRASVLLFPAPVAVPSGTTAGSSSHGSSSSSSSNNNSNNSSTGGTAQCMAMLGSTLVVVHSGHAYEVALSSERVAGAGGKAAPSPYTAALLDVAYGNPVVAMQAALGWAAPPTALCAAATYLVALLPRALEVHHGGTQQRVQSLAAPERAPFTLAAAAPDGRRCVLACAGAAPAGVYELRMQSLEKQVSDLLAVRKIDDAVQLFRLVRRDRAGTPEYAQQLARIHRDAADILVRDLQFSEAFDHYTLADVDPRAPLRWFPDVFPEHQQQQQQQQPHGPDPQDHDVEQLIAATLRKPRADPAVQKQLQGAKQCLLDYLLLRQRVLSQKQAPQAPGQLAQPSVGGNGIDSDAEVLADVNTAVVKLLAELRPGDVEAFVRANRGALHAASVETFLRARRMWHTLAVCYDVAGRVRDALGIWRRLGTGELADPPHNGVNETVAVLARPTTPAALVWDYADWLVRAHASAALRVFLGSPRAWDVDEVARYLEARDLPAARKYLENRVFTEATADPRHYTRLLSMYITDLIAAVRAHPTPTPTPTPTGPTGGTTGGGTGGDGENNSNAETASEGAPPPPPPPPGETQILLARGPEYLDTRNKLLALLQRGDAPLADGAEAVLRAIAAAGLADRDLFDEQIAAYARLGRHRDVLRIVLGRLHDDARAETYCRDRRTPAEAADLLATLLGMYLELDGALRPDAPVLTARAQRLLLRHGREIDPLRALAALPDATSLASLYPFLAKCIQETTHRRRDSDVLRALLRAQLLQTRCDLVAQQHAPIPVDDHTICAVCKKELADKVFVRPPPPAPRLICYRCWTRTSNTAAPTTPPPASPSPSPHA